MATSNSPTVPSSPSSVNTLRLSLAPEPGADRLDGGWWPHSRDLVVELAQLVDGFPPEAGRIVRASYSRPDWKMAPRWIRAERGWVKVGFLPRDDHHLIDVNTPDRRVLRLLVVPHDFTEGQGQEALLAAATWGNRHSAEDLLERVTDQADVDPSDVWEANSGSLWASDVQAPTYRGET